MVETSPPDSVYRSMTTPMRSWFRLRIQRPLEWSEVRAYFLFMTEVYSSALTLQPSSASIDRPILAISSGV